MKLYTEEQVKVLINALEDIKNWDEELEDEWEDCGYRAINALNQFLDEDEIELPSDEKIIYRCFQEDSYELATDGDSALKTYTDGYRAALEQILNQNK